MQKRGWRGRAAELDALIHELMTLVDAVCLGIDVGEDIGPNVGIECYYIPKRPPSLEPRWYVLLDFLVEKGLCTPQKRAALLQYPGYAHEDSDRDQWPEFLLSMSRLQSSQYLSTIDRGLHHIKVLFDGERAVQAKAYLSVEHLWLSRDDIRQALEQSGR